MEEKVSFLEALGVIKGLISETHWLSINGPEHNIPISTHKNKHSENIFDFKDDVIVEKKTYLNSNEKECRPNVSDQLKFTEEGVAEKSGSAMEKNKSENNIPDEGKKDIDELNNNEKTEFNKSNHEKSLILFCDSNKSISLEGAFKSFEEFESGRSDDFNNNESITDDKIPSSVLEWVNHLPSKDKSSKSNAERRNSKEQENPAEEIPTVSARLSREASVQSNSSLDSLLDSRRPDPVEIFLNLGFGGVPGVNMENCRIPRRFLVPSKCKGGDWNEFLKRELLQAQNFECSSLGFRGLSGPSYRRPSAIVANIMEKLRERTVPPAHPRSRFSSVARKVLNEKSVVNKLTLESQSVLSPDSRKFLQNQGKISPEVPRRRIIFGQKSFAFARDGEFVEVEPSTTDSSEDKPSERNAKEKENEESPQVFPSPEVLLKLRRSSLQKQKKVDEDEDVDDVFYIVSNEERTGNTGTSSDPETTATSTAFKGNEDRAAKAGKIPKRFFSSTNLKALEKENDLSEAMRTEVEKEIRTLSQKIKNIRDHELASILEQVKQLRSRLENSGQESPEK